MATTVMFTKKGREIVAGRLTGAGSPTQTEAKNLGWGIGAGTASQNDVAPFQEAAEARVVGTSSLVTTTTANDTYQVVGTLTSASPQTITETFLSDTSAKPASTTAPSGITNVATSLTVASASGFPGSGSYYIQIDSEVLQVTAGAGTTTWTVARNQNGTAAVSHSSGAIVTGGNIPGSTAVTSGNLLIHASFTGLALNNGDSLTATTQLSFS
jgi:hypothetical protein